MTHRLPPLAACAAALLALASCNSSPPPQAAAPAPQQAAAPGVKLPEGAGCTSTIERYRAVVSSDHQTGNVGEGVYKQIDGEISGASAACAAGRDADAMRMLAASKSRHGYPG